MNDDQELIEYVIEDNISNLDASSNPNLDATNIRQNYVNNINAQNQANSLKQKVNSYNRNNNVASKNSKGNTNSNGVSSSNKNNTTSRINSATGKNGAVSALSKGKGDLASQAASTALTSAGVPKPLADAAVNSKLGQKAISNIKKKNPLLKAMDMLSGNKEEEADDDVSVSFLSAKGTIKLIKWSLILGGPVLTVIVFCCLLIAASQIYLGTFSLGAADDVVMDKNAEEKIKNQKEEDLNKEIKDEDEVTYDFFINDEELNNKSSKLVFVDIIKTRPGNEADLEDLNGFFPSIGDYTSEYDSDAVYKFFFKLYYINKYYETNYGVTIDMPLLMATLKLQSSDMNVIFTSNTKNYDETLKEDNPNFLYDKDWSKENYITNKSNSEHDIEVLVQHMVGQKTVETCVNSSGIELRRKESETGEKTLECLAGETYKTELVYDVDTDQYKEFLKEFIEKKYYLDSDTPLSSNTPEGNNQNNNNTQNNNSGNNNGQNEFATAMIALANQEYSNNQGYNDGAKYIDAYGGFSYGTPWCAMFAWYVSANTKVNGQSLYPDIIPFKTASTGRYIKYFNSSDKDNINFYYNDNCSNLKGKNGDMLYIPKAGDYIFFDWDAKYYDISSNTQDHTAIVEKYENGIIYTIEGNSGNTIQKRTYSIKNCVVIGFGSWY